MLYIIYIFRTAFIIYVSSSVNYFQPEFDKYLILDLIKNYKTFILF